MLPCIASSTRKPPRSDEEAMTNRRRAAALLLLPLLFVVAITSIGRYLHIFAAFDFFGAKRPPLRRKNERAVGASRVTSPKGGDKQIGSGATNTSGAATIGYIFSNRQGYSRFGKFYGNGNVAEQRRGN